MKNERKPDEIQKVYGNRVWRLPAVLSRSS